MSTNWSKSTALADILLTDIMSVSKKDIKKLSVDVLCDLCHHLVVKFGKMSPPDLKDNMVISSINSLEKRIEDLKGQIDGFNSALSDQIADCKTSVEGCVNGLGERMDKGNQLLSSQITDSNVLLAKAIADGNQMLADCIPRKPTQPPLLLESNTSVNSSESVCISTSDAGSPTSCHRENVIPEELRERLLAFCKTLKYEPESGHGASPFGEIYRYKKPYKNYAKSEEQPPPIPPVVKELTALLVNEFPELADVNQCLINEFVGKECFLVKHEDNEGVIDPLSSIITFVIGDEAEIHFSPKGHQNEPVCISPKDGSMYIMTRKSQDTWSHEIKKSEGRSESFRRYTVTLRTVGQRFVRSTVILGDSNTEHLNFGNVSRSFGYNMPGQRIKASKISDINPLDCTGYSNIIVHAGLNDLKPYRANVPELADALITKVEQIRTICPRARVTVNPVLPTLLTSINVKAVQFNNILSTYIDSSAPNNNRLRMLDCSSFEDQRTGLLREDLMRYRKRDNFHLGSDGFYMLSRLIRERVRGSRVNGSSYAGVASNNDFVRNDLRHDVKRDVRRGVRGEKRGDMRGGMRGDMRGGMRYNERDSVRSEMNMMASPRTFGNSTAVQSAQT